MPGESREEFERDRFGTAGPVPTPAPAEALRKLSASWRRIANEIDDGTHISACSLRACDYRCRASELEQALAAAGTDTGTREGSPARLPDPGVQTAGIVSAPAAAPVPQMPAPSNDETYCSICEGPHYGPSETPASARPDSKLSTLIGQLYGLADDFAELRDVREAAPSASGRCERCGDEDDVVAVDKADVLSEENLCGECISGELNELRAALRQAQGESK